MKFSAIIMFCLSIAFGGLTIYIIATTETSIGTLVPEFICALFAGYTFRIGIEDWKTSLKKKPIWPDDE